MAPEVILQTVHSFSADIWSVGCTVIEMATGKPPWSQQYQEVAALFYIGTTKSHPPIPEPLSVEAKDFLLKCLQKEPNLRPAASELLQHPFVTGEQVECHPVFHTSVTENSGTLSLSSATDPETFKMSTGPGLTDLCKLDSLRRSAECPEKSSEKKKRTWELNNSDDDMCQIDKDDFIMQEAKLGSSLMPENFKSFNPMCEPSDGWGCKFAASPEPEQTGINPDTKEHISEAAGCSGVFGEGDKDYSFPCGPSLSEDEDELTESKITAFLDEKAFELKKLQKPMYEEFYNSLAPCSVSFVESTRDETTTKCLKLPPKSKTPSQGPTGAPSPAVDSLNTGSPGSNSRLVSNIGNASDQSSQDNPSPLPNDWKGLAVDAQQEPSSPSMSFSERHRKWKEELDQELERKRGRYFLPCLINRSEILYCATHSMSFFERHRKWKEELDQELERKREMMRQQGVGGKTSSPKDQALNRQRERTRFASPGK